MAGLSLGVGAYGNAGVGAGLPVAANSPTGTTISQRAFGITANSGGGRAVAGYGTVAAGAAGALLLAWLWWTLPR